MLNQGLKGKVRLENNRIPICKIKILNFEGDGVGTHCLIFDEDQRLRLIEFLIE